MKASYGFSFKYGDKKFDQNDLKVKGTANGDALVKTGVLDADSSLEVTGALTEYPEYATKYWVTEYANVGTEDTKNISELNDADVLISFDEPYKPAKRGYYNDKYVTVTAFHGSQYGIYEYGGMEKEIRMGNAFIEGSHAAHGLARGIDPAGIDGIGLRQGLKQPHGHIDLL